MRKLDDARFELGEYRKPRLSRTSLQCFWRRPLGHTWEMKESRGKPVLRCAACGKVTRGPRGWVDKRDDPDLGTKESVWRRRRRRAEAPARWRRLSGASSEEAHGRHAGGHERDPEQPARRDRVLVEADPAEVVDGE